MWGLQCTSDRQRCSVRTCRFCSCGRGRRCSCQHGCRRKRRYVWYNPSRCRWVLSLLHRGDVPLRVSLCKLCSRSGSRCHTLPSRLPCRLQPCHRDVQGHDRGHQLLWFQLHHSGCSNGFLLPFRCRSVQWLLSTRRSYDRGRQFPPFRSLFCRSASSRFRLYVLLRCRWVLLLRH